MCRWWLSLTTAVWLAALSSGCAPSATRAFDASSWRPEALRADSADFVAAVDLEALRADPLFGPILAPFARELDFQVLLRASQIDVVAMADDDGELDTWVAVVHGVDGPPSAGDVGAGLIRDVVTVRGAWLLGEGPAFQRVRAHPPQSLDRMTLPSRAFAATAAQGRALRFKRNALDDTTQGLTRVDGVLLGGRHIELVARAEYADAAAAHRAVALVRLLLFAAAARNDDWAPVAHALTTVDFEESGNSASLRLTVSDQLRDLLETYVKAARR
jgi:hypothetical protein